MNNILKCRLLVSGIYITPKTCRADHKIRYQHQVGAERLPFTCSWTQHWLCGARNTFGFKEVLLNIEKALELPIITVRVKNQAPVAIEALPKSFWTARHIIKFPDNHHLHSEHPIVKYVRKWHSSIQNPRLPGRYPSRRIAEDEDPWIEIPCVINCTPVPSSILDLQSLELSRCP